MVRITVTRITTANGVNWHWAPWPIWGVAHRPAGCSTGRPVFPKRIEVGCSSASGGVRLSFTHDNRPEPVLRRCVNRSLPPDLRRIRMDSSRPTRSSDATEHSTSPTGPMVSDPGGVGPAFTGSSPREHLGPCRPIVHPRKSRPFPSCLGGWGQRADWNARRPGPRCCDCRKTPGASPWKNCCGVARWRIGPSGSWPECTLSGFWPTPAVGRSTI